MEALRQLMDGGTVAASALRTDMAETLRAEGLITTLTHGSRRAFRAIDAAALKRFLQSRYEELRLMDDETGSWSTRASMAASTGNSKLLAVRSCPGFPVNSFEPVRCSLSGTPLVVNPPEGSFVFVDDWRHFVVPDEVVVVGIENMENFRMIRRQRRLFQALAGDKPLLFVSRYPQSTDLRRWLQTIPNPYVHFGDFDLAGIHIFLTEFYKHLGERSSFLIPADIEQRLSTGSLARYNAQHDKFHSLRSDIPSLQALIDLIHKYHRGYDQEGYIE